MLNHLYETKIVGNLSHFFTYQELKECFTEIGEQDLCLVLKWLQLNNKTLEIAYGPKREKKGYKFPFAAENTEKIVSNEYDRNIYSLKEALRKVEKSVYKLSEEISELRKQAKLQLSNKNKTNCKAILRKKKLLESILLKRSDTLHNLVELKESIESAMSNSLILDVMKLGSETIKGVHKEKGITEERVQEVIQEAEEAIVESNQIGEVLAEGIQTQVFDEQELDRELADLAETKPPMSPLNQKDDENQKKRTPEKETLDKEKMMN